MSNDLKPLSSLDATPKTLLNAAYCNVQAMSLLIPCMSGTGLHILTPPFFLLAGFGYEQAFKAFLMSKGWTAEELKRKIGHDLVAAHDAAISQGLSSTNALGLSNAVIRLQPFHTRFLMRYLPEVSSITMPGVDTIATPLGTLIEDLKDQINLA